MPRLPPDDPPLIARANARFSSSFRRTVRSVLRDASVASHRRTMSLRVRERMTAASAAGEEDEPEGGGRRRSTDPRAALLEVTREDVESCHRLAGRVGRGWAEALRAGGYAENGGHVTVEGFALYFALQRIAKMYW